MKTLIKWLFSILETKKAQEMLLELATILAERTGNKVDDLIVKKFKEFVEEDKE